MPVSTAFPGRWIGRGGPVPWPARSPDLNPLHYVTAPKSWAQKSVFQSVTAFIYGRHLRSYKRRTHSTSRRQRYYRKTRYYYAWTIRRTRKLQGGFSHLDSKNYPRRRTHGIRYISLLARKT